MDRFDVVVGPSRSWSQILISPVTLIPLQCITLVYGGSDIPVFPPVGYRVSHGSTVPGVYVEGFDVDTNPPVPRTDKGRGRSRHLLRRVGTDGVTSVTEPTPGRSTRWRRQLRGRLLHVDGRIFTPSYWWTLTKCDRPSLQNPRCWQFRKSLRMDTQGSFSLGNRFRGKSIGKPQITG